MFLKIGKVRPNATKFKYLIICRELFVFATNSPPTKCWTGKMEFAGLHPRAKWMEWKTWLLRNGQSWRRSTATPTTHGIQCNNAIISISFIHKISWILFGFYRQNRVTADRSSMLMSLPSIGNSMPRQYLPICWHACQNGLFQ